MDAKRTPKRGAEGYSAFEAQRDATGGGWTAMRYHCDGGRTVAETLSFRSVFEINPFETGRSHAAGRRAYTARKDAVLEALDVEKLMRRSFASLSNGEMRRVLLAKELLKCPARLEVRDPEGGLDPGWRKKMRSLARTISATGTELVLAKCMTRTGDEDGENWVKRRPAGAKGSARGRPVLEMAGVNMSFGRRTLFKNFSWTVREGERWILRGSNGSGKTTLLALATGDSPMSYAFDISLFGAKRSGEGTPLAKIRRRIGMVSSEREAVEGIAAEEQLDAALKPSTRLLLLDEPCCNLPPKRAKAFLSRVSRWLDAHPSAAAICVAHSRKHVPPGFDRELNLARGV